MFIKKNALTSLASSCMKGVTPYFPLHGYDLDDRVECYEEISDFAEEVHVRIDPRINMNILQNIHVRPHVDEYERTGASQWSAFLILSDNGHIIHSEGDEHELSCGDVIILDVYKTHSLKVKNMPEYKDGKAKVYLDMLARNYVFTGILIEYPNGEAPDIDSVVETYRNRLSP